MCREVQEGRFVINETGGDDHKKLKDNSDKEMRRRREADRRAKTKTNKLVAAALRDND